jgi:outer membrane protein OmpA-like peptidoglycan-associated protein
MRALAVIALSIVAAACGASGAGAKGPVKRTLGEKARPDAAKLEDDPDAKAAAKTAMDHRATKYERIAVGDQEIDLDPGARVDFEPGKDRLDARSYDVLYEIDSYLEGNPAARIRIEANTDDVGDRETNIDLSGRRAARVFSFFVDAGIDPARLEYVGCGPDNPRISDTTPEARAANRRVDFVFAKEHAIVCGGVYE